MFDLFAAIGLVVEEDVAAATPHGGADGGEGHVGWDDLWGLMSVFCRRR